MQKKITVLQKKAIRIMSFADFNAHTSELFKQWEIIKMNDLVDIQNCVLSHSFINETLPESFKNFFEMCEDIYDFETRSSESHCIWIPRVNTSTYGLNSTAHHCILTWNKFAHIFDNLHLYSRAELVELLQTYFINTY